MSHIDEDTKRRLRAMAYELDDILAEAEPDDDLRPIPREDGNTKPRLAVIVGHTKRSQGALGMLLATPENPTGSEYMWNYDLANRMNDGSFPTTFLSERFTRDKGGIRGAYARAKAWGADAAIELHFNAAGSPSATGTETIYGDKARDNDFAWAIQNAMVKTLGLRDRGVKPPWHGRGAVNLSLLDVPSIIIEPGFGSNESDCKRLLEKKNQLAIAIFLAAKKYLLDATHTHEGTES